MSMSIDDVVSKFDPEHETGLRCVGAKLPGSIDPAFVAEVIRGLVEEKEHFVLFYAGGKIFIGSDAAAYFKDLLPEKWSDGRWHIGHEPHGPDLDDDRD
ncbi:hypothetical protein FFK22_038575 [Mycobacterium sp. KBS0706]|uniref:hypothetical protein n=1 Tax=Mycobacterium sp. KBS0706 TaxID=2578109 RepID=UPI00110F9031|nr:hypothetical protein [Mycobacterium sp. KBS0706]TSD83273.1 hypothetical protein FFK22_038575 [Mycobacterium sp. KBS0706]